MLWMELKISTLLKTDGGIRPLGLAEVLFKIATGSCLDESSEALGALLRPSQFGVGVQAGAHQLYMQACGLYTSVYSLFDHMPWPIVLPL